MVAMLLTITSNFQQQMDFLTYNYQHRPIFIFPSARELLMLRHLGWIVLGLGDSMVFSNVSCIF